jgi:hypothetical protein
METKKQTGTIKAVSKSGGILFDKDWFNPCNPKLGVDVYEANLKGKKITLAIDEDNKYFMYELFEEKAFETPVVNKDYLKTKIIHGVDMSILEGDVNAFSSKVKVRFQSHEVMDNKLIFIIQYEDL